MRTGSQPAEKDNHSRKFPPLAQNNSVTLTPEVKQLIAEEVRQELAAEQAAAAQRGPLQPTGAAQQSAVPDAPPPALDAKVKVFVVSTGLNLTAGSDGQTCALTPGDIIERTGRDVTADGQVPVSVLTSKDGDCPVDSASALDVSALQDMHNEFREQISAGMEKLASDRGKGGLPAGPAADPKQVAEGQASPSADAKDLLAKQVQEADRTEAEVNDLRREWMVDVQGELRRSVHPPLPIGPVKASPQRHGATESWHLS